MKQVRTAIMRRPKTLDGAAARSKKEAAIHLVRLEFDLSRLQAGLDQAEARRAHYTAEIAEKSRKRARLMEILGG